MGCESLVRAAALLGVVSSEVFLVAWVDWGLASFFFERLRF